MTREDVEKVLKLRNEAVKHYDDVIKEQNFRFGYSQLAIDLLDGTIDINKLVIDYIMEKL